MEFHHDLISRQELIRSYLANRVDEHTAEAFESHYLACDECFEDLRLTRLLVDGLSHSRIQLRRVDDVLVLQFAGPAQLTRQTFELEEMERAFWQKDSKVLIDLGSVLKIVSAGLGQLMSYYSHVVKNQGKLKLLNPSREVERL